MEALTPRNITLPDLTYTRIASHHQTTAHCLHPYQTSPRAQAGPHRPHRPHLAKLPPDISPTGSYQLRSQTARHPVPFGTSTDCHIRPSLQSSLSSLQDPPRSRGRPHPTYIGISSIPWPLTWNFPPKRPNLGITLKRRCPSFEPWLTSLCSFLRDQIMCLALVH